MLHRKIARAIAIGYHVDMNAVRNFQPISVRDYLDGERCAKRKHEYLEGFVYAMAGASNLHNRIATNATVSLGSQLRGRPCQVFNSDTKVRVQFAHGTRFYYPDSMVVCEPNSNDDVFHDAPVVIVEIVSESTRRTDEYEKREAYLSIHSLIAYILFEQSAPLAVVYRRRDGEFVNEPFSRLEAVVPLHEIGCKLRLNDVYDNVIFPTAEQLREEALNYDTA